MLPRREQPLFGRSAELGRVRALTAQPAEGGDRALIVLGDAGIGKSTLLADLTAYWPGTVLAPAEELGPITVDAAGHGSVIR